MSSKPTWKEALKEYHSIKKAEFEKTNNGNFSRNPNYKREKDNFKPEGYRFYNPNNFTTKPQEIYRNLDERERLKEIDRRRKGWAMDEKKEEYKVLSLNATITVGHATESWKSLDDRTVKAEARKRTENGKNIDMAIKTLKNFNIDDMKSKIEVIQAFNSATYVLKNFNDLRNGVITKSNKRFEKFLERYEILEEPYIDLETGMSALVIGNRKTKNVEIIFGASQDPSNIFRKDEPRKLENFKGSEKLKKYIERGENAKYATMDWAGNNLKSPVVTPSNQKVALKFAEEIQEKYKNGYNGYMTLTDTN
ncbi:MAG: hypothetical protein Q4D53_06085, partial [Leptotrichiaceae bacterium]|nr:hypothetical protein [Leptotrichiaceae bacterium]